MMPRPRFRWLVLAWLLAVGMMAWLAPLGKNPWAFGALYPAGFALMLLMVRHFPVEWSGRRTFTLIFGLAIFSRLLFLPSPPGSDLNRYIWEGAIQLSGINPYLFAPDHNALAALAGGRLAEVWTGINHKDVTAAYPPLTLLFFRFLASLRPQALTFKLFFTAVDVGLILVLAFMIRLRGLPPQRLLLYAANPLVLVFVAGEGHFDGLQAMWLWLALLMLLTGRSARGFLALGLAGATKYLAGAVWPFWIHAGNWKKAFFVFLPLALYGLYWGAGLGLVRSLFEFGTKSHYNDAVMAVLRVIFGPAAPAVGFGLALTGFVAIYLTVHDPVRSTYLALGLLLLLLPTLHPWYLLMMAPFACVYPSRAWLYLQAAAVFTFPVMARDYQSGVFQEIHWLKWFEYLPFFFLLLRDTVTKRSFCPGRVFARPSSVTVVIPAINEDEHIGRCLQSLRAQPELKEVFVVDGGSSDDTRRAAELEGARVIDSRPGRGVQAAAGIRQAGGDVILILHADCRLAPEALKRLLHALRMHADAAGGAFGMRFSDRRLRCRLIAWLNNLRALVTGISFGDQGQFFRPEALAPVGGYPGLPLMEDVELSLRLKEIGPVLYLGRGVTASARRWQGRGFGGRFRLVLRLFTGYLLARRWRGGKLDAGKYYSAYYG